MSYRDVHLDKGQNYDENLRTDPFDAYMANEERKLLPRIVGSLFQAPIPKYLDFACGTGRILAQLESFASQALGVDISASMLEQAKKRCNNAQFLCEDLTTSANDLRDFDLVTSFRFFGNADDDLRLSALRQISGLLRPGGYLIMNNHRNPHSIISTLARLRGLGSPLSLTHSELDRLLGLVGMRPVSRHGIGFCVVRGRFAQPEVLDSPIFQWLDRISRVNGLARFCPDAIIVAQKAS